MNLEFGTFLLSTTQLVFVKHILYVLSSVGKEYILFQNLLPKQGKVEHNVKPKPFFLGMITQVDPPLGNKRGRQNMKD